MTNTRILPFTIQRNKTLPPLLILATFLLSFTPLAGAAEIVILSSDESIERYRETSKAFSDQFSLKIKTEDLGKLNDRGLRKIKKKVAGSKPDLLFAVGAKALSFALKEFDTVPVLFSSVLNWKRFKNIGSNVSGIASEVSAKTQLTLYRYVFPSIKKIGLIYNPEYNNEWFEAARREAESLGFTLYGVEFERSDSIKDKLKPLIPEIDAFWLISDPVVITLKTTTLILTELDKVKKPIFSYRDFFIKSGATISVSIKSQDIGKQAAAFAKSLLEGDIIDEKVRLPKGSSVTLNLYQVKKYGLTFNRDALGSINNIVSKKASPIGTVKKRFINPRLQR